MTTDFSETPKEYSWEDTYKRGLLRDYLKACDGANKLYVSGYFFLLNDFKELHFFYNPKFYWDSLPLKALTPSIEQRLTAETAVIDNFSLIDPGILGAPQGYEPCPSFEINTPRLGNHYRYLGTQILTTEQDLYLADSLSMSSFHLKKEIRQLNKIDLNAMMKYEVYTLTPHQYQRVSDLPYFQY